MNRILGTAKVITSFVVSGGLALACTRPTDSPVSNREENDESFTPIQNAYCIGGQDVLESGEARQYETFWRIRLMNELNGGSKAVLEQVRLTGWSKRPIVYPMFSQFKNAGFNVVNVASKKELEAPPTTHEFQLYKFEETDKQKFNQYAIRGSTYDQFKRFHPNAKVPDYVFLKNENLSRVVAFALRSNDKGKSIVFSNMANIYYGYLPCEEFKIPALVRLGRTGDRDEFVQKTDDAGHKSYKTEYSLKTLLEVDQLLRPKLPIQFAPITREDLARTPWCQFSLDFRLISFLGETFATSNINAQRYGNEELKDLKIERTTPNAAKFEGISNQGEILMSWNDREGKIITDKGLFYRDSEGHEFITLRTGGIEEYFVSRVFRYMRCTDSRIVLINPRISQVAEEVHQSHIKAIKGN